MSESSYHHGDLRNALLSAAEQILREQGPEALTLRACARQAGVSHAAPTHHFGNIAGLLTALACIGFQRMLQVQQRMLSDEPSDPTARAKVAGMGYIQFALDNPALFDLMFRDPRIDWQDAALVSAFKAARQPVFDAIHALEATHGPAPGQLSWIKAWSLVHGFSTLATSGLLRNTDSTQPQQDLQELMRKLFD
ncbi:TetR/AcrR family transcriptional regulator [Chitinivorax sp. PXF-14]|uniref:TetR/AcrR family transcriptional regulator n=1 Tax=Chitinivorax sp. PXF-14 TaxID=3230488 RepID=UPI0034661954